MKKLFSATILMLTLLLVFSVTSNVFAGHSEKIITPVKKEINPSEHKANTRQIESQNKEESATNKTEEEGKAGEEEEEAAWKIPGWESIFTFLAIGYYIVVSLNILPKIAAKELEGHH